MLPNIIYCDVIKLLASVFKMQMFLDHHGEIKRKKERDREDGESILDLE